MTLYKYLVATGVLATQLSPSFAHDITEPTTGRNIGIACAACHGTDGVSHGSVPTLKGHNAAKLEEDLLNFRSGKMDSTIMKRIARGYTPDEITAVSDYFGSMR
ncbi:MAG: c-type cytochrome [bacterium]